MQPSDLIYGTGKYERKPMDFYPTPADVTHALIDHLEKHLMIGEGSVVLEPACGDGHMSEVIKERGYYVRSTDIRHTGYADWNEGGGVDFTGPGWFAGLDWIITNPPFNVSEAFIRKCLSYNVPFALLLKSQYWHSMKRNALFYERKPMFVCPLSWRPAFEGKGKSSLMDFVWTIWGREREWRCKILAVEEERRCEMDNINDVIDNICEKIGVTAEYIVPEYARMKIAGGITQLILFMVIVVAIILFGKWLRGHGDDELIGGYAVAGGGACIIIFILASITISDIVAYVVAPYSAFIVAILNKIG